MPFTSDEFKSDPLKDQTITFCGERAKHTKWCLLEERSRAALLRHHSLARGPTVIHLWSFCVQLGLYLENHLPRNESRLSPMEILEGQPPGTVAIHCRR